jgi:hypothetical protein
MFIIEGDSFLSSHSQSFKVTYTGFHNGLNWRKYLCHGLGLLSESPTWQSQSQIEKRLTAEDAEDPGESKSFYPNQSKFNQGQEWISSPLW